MQKLKRSRDYEIRLNIANDDFVSPPRPSQRNWLLNRLVTEWAVELNHLDAKARSFVAGNSTVSEDIDRKHGDLSDQAIMEDWQIPVMQAMASVASDTQGDVLEIGFGRGVSAEFIQAENVRSHTIVECNEHIIDRYERWKAGYEGRDIRMLQGLWQDLTEEYKAYDAIFFHAYPLTGDELIEEIHKTATFASSFFPVAAKHLREGGVFTYLTNEADSLSRAHQRLILDHFSSMTLSRVDNLEVPTDTDDSLWGESMVIVKAVR